MGYIIELSGKILQDLDSFAKKHNISRVEATKRAFAVLSIANREKEKGHELWVIKVNEEQIIPVSRITGI